MARRSVDEREEVDPLYPAAVIRFDAGMIVGAHKTAMIANLIQKKLQVKLQGAMNKEGFALTDWGVLYHSKSHRIEHVWYVERSSAGVQEVVARNIEDHEFMMLPEELMGPAVVMHQLQTQVTTFWERAEELMEVKGLSQDDIRAQARKAYKSAQKSINDEVDAGLIDGFDIGGIWLLASTEQMAERKSEWNVAKAVYLKSFTHSRRDRMGLAKSIILSPEDAEVWTDEFKKEANKYTIQLRRVLHHQLGAVVLDGCLGGAQAVPEEGTQMEKLTEAERESGELAADIVEAMTDLEEGMSRVTAIQEEGNAAPKASVSFESETDATMAEATEEEVDDTDARGGRRRRTGRIDD
jgi:hypothetical protein